MDHPNELKEFSSEDYNDIKVAILSVKCNERIPSIKIRNFLAKKRPINFKINNPHTNAIKRLAWGLWLPELT